MARCGGLVHCIPYKVKKKLKGAFMRWKEIVVIDMLMDFV